jgi:hypothetical protein
MSESLAKVLNAEKFNDVLERLRTCTNQLNKKIRLLSEESDPKKVYEILKDIDDLGEKIKADFEIIHASEHLLGLPEAKQAYRIMYRYYEPYLPGGQEMEDQMIKCVNDLVQRLRIEKRNYQMHRSGTLSSQDYVNLMSMSWDVITACLLAMKVVNNPLQRAGISKILNTHYDFCEMYREKAGSDVDA